MPVRLPVVLVQTKPPTASGQRIAEEVVGNLIGKPGIDLTLVDTIPSLAEGSTDRLTLESLSGDVVILDWFEPAAIVQRLAEIGFEGRRSSHEHDSGASEESSSESPVIAGSAPRRIYAFDLSRFTKAMDLIDALVRLNDTRQVRTFTIGIGGPVASKSPETAETGDAGPGNAVPGGVGSDAASEERRPAALTSLRGESTSSRGKPTSSRGKPTSSRGDSSDSSSTPFAGESVVSEDLGGRRASAETNASNSSADRNVPTGDSSTGRPAADSKAGSPSQRGGNELDLDQLIDDLDQLDP